MRIVGHHYIWELLVKSNKAGKVSHAYLFSGPDKVGKKTLALEFIKLLNCQEADINKRPCQKCFSCREIENKVSPDLVLIEAQRKEIQISQIRNLSWKLSLEPYSNVFKSAIIDNAHLMNKEAQSALLKTLEEPRGRAVIILITSFPELLLPTIVSRTEKIRFSLVPQKEIKKYLLEKNTSPQLIDKILSLSPGRPGEVIEVLNNPEKLKKIDQKIKDLERLINSSIGERFRYAKSESQDFNQLRETLDIWLRYFRDKLRSSLETSSEKNSLAKYKRIINLIQDINLLLFRTEVNKKLALETLLLEL